MFLTEVCILLEAILDLHLKKKERNKEKNEKKEKRKSRKKINKRYKTTRKKKDK